MYSKEYGRLRTKAIQRFDAFFYEPHNLRRCHHWVWDHFARHIWGISYKTYLAELRKNTDDVPDMPQRAFDALLLFAGRESGGRSVRKHDLCCGERRPRER